MCYFSCLKFAWKKLMLKNLLNFCDVLEECCIYRSVFIARGERALLLEDNLTMKYFMQTYNVTETFSAKFYFF